MHVSGPAWVPFEWQALLPNMLIVARTSKLLHVQQCLDLINSTVEQCTSELGQEHPLTKMIKHTANFSQRHKDIIVKYGRFPHRNEILGRKTTEEEAVGLADGSIEGF